MTIDDRNRFLKLFILSVCLSIHVDLWADNYSSNNYRPENVSVRIGETNLPIVFIDTRCGGNSNKVIHRDYRIAVRMKIVDNGNGVNYEDTLAHPDQHIDYEGWIGIKYRGNSSFDVSPKKPYSIKTLESDDVNSKKRKVSIMGMGRDQDWVLMAPYADRSMIRDVLMFQLARPYFEYTPLARHCEVVIDGIYYGVFIMSERPHKGKYRLNLEDPGDSGDALTGGYHLQVDRHDEEVYRSKYPTLDQYGNPYPYYNKVYFQYKHPEYDEMMPDHENQLHYIQGRIDAMESSLASEDFRDLVTGYRQYLDITSFIDYELSQEVSSNTDGYRLSTNIYKYRDSKDPRFKTALWDFNIAFGNANYDDGAKTDFWQFQNRYIRDEQAINKVPFWWRRMMEDPDYVKQLKGRWAEYRQGAYDNSRIVECIDSMVKVLDASGARQRNYEVWPVWGKYIWPVPDYVHVDTWEKEIDYLKSWISQRIAWMDNQLDYEITKQGIDNLVTPYKKRIVGYYNLRGERLEKPNKGIDVVRYADGSSRKIVIH